MTDIRIPEDLWNDDDEGVISSWLYQNGDPVQQGAVVAQILLDKAQMDLISPASGVLRIVTPEEIPVRKGQIVAHLE